MVESTVCLWFNEYPAPTYHITVWMPAVSVDELIMVAMLLSGVTYVVRAMVETPSSDGRSVVYTRSGVELRGQSYLEYRVSAIS